jgi:hypothetical protein
MSEKQFQAVVVASAQRHGWLVYHTYDSRRSEPGYPDLHLVHVRAGQSVFRELKTETGRLSAQQTLWLGALNAVGVDADVWRPMDWFTGKIGDFLAAASRHSQHPRVGGTVVDPHRTSPIKEGTAR